MSISNNILAAFVAGVSTKQEDELVMKESSDNEDFSDLLDVLDDVDAVDGMNELRNEFCETLMVGKSLRIIILVLNRISMNKTLLSLFEQNEQTFREELSLILLPRDNKKLQDFMKDFFINKVSVEEYKKELSVNEIAMLNSVMKLVVLQIPSTSTPSGLQDDGNKAQDVNTKDSCYAVNMKTLGFTAIGSLAGSILFKTWGGVLLSIAGCAFGMYISSKSRQKQNREVNRKIDVSKYIQTLKGICKSIDDVILTIILV